MNHDFESNLAALATYNETHAVPELPEGEYEELRDSAVELVIPEELADGLISKPLRDALERVTSSLIVDTLTQYREELRDIGVLAYLEDRHTVVNRAHADNPSAANLSELELIGRLLREVDA